MPNHPERNDGQPLVRNPERSEGQPPACHPEQSDEGAESKDPALSEKDDARQQPKAERSRNTLVFGVVALAWLALDTLTKSFFNGSHSLGEVIAGPFLGLVRFRLVHNTGAAWGMFGDSTFLLGVLSIAVCLVLVAYLFFLSPRPSLIEVVGVALVVAGGLGNAFDRFTLGYVVDFIEPVFIDFPVFNVADIGVTCGFVLFVAGMVLAYRRADREAAALAGGEGPRER
ncbi:signal peptidase II [Gordonibacter sp. 28C]|uniref:signal peptidase II n=1 Tax=Gordonibacter sp. 28C TaxID=2078569 RepID=UPI000DF733A0|nr:signal peptidase II [Gordonibacter sp. 28C]RDB59437.1 signal peptidase II [Gordonibacter sp. 28C]